MISKDFNRGLFGNELQVLESALTDISNDKYRGNELLSRYQSLAQNYDKLLRITRKVFRISDTQGKELKRRENEIKNLLDNSNEGFLTFDYELLVNREYSLECTRIFGGKISNMDIIELLSAQNPELGRLYYETFNHIFQTHDSALWYQYIEKLPNILIINGNSISIKYKVIQDSEYANEDIRIMLILMDITEKRKAEDQVLYLSYHDKLTSLYNRAYIDTIISQLQSSIELPFSVIMADMNGLKLTNDVFGHKYGDKLLVNLSNVFIKSCRKGDIIARWGGDEFLILLPGVGSYVCQQICERIKRTCGEIAPDPIELSVSLGMATMEESNTDISELFSLAENMMYSNKLVESKNIRKKIILSMEKILHTKCFESFEHIDRIKKISMNFADYIGIKKDSIDRQNLMLLATLHDIGKVAIPRDILSKPGPLTENEWNIMRSHTEIGFRMAQSIDEPILAQSILTLRERWDGKGYPYGLKGEQIPLITRIISIADAYDVMTHDRPYRKGIKREDALNELQKGAGSQFDPNLVGIFLENDDAITA